jgi:hypothetical protein
MAVRTGRCHCEQVKYQVTGEPVGVGNCYCRTCRKVTGSPFFSVALYPGSQLKVDDSSKPKSYKTSESGTRYFCCNCGANTHDVFNVGGKEMCCVTLATLDDGHGLKPTYSMMVKYNAPWVQINDGLPQFDEFPPM